MGIGSGLRLHAGGVCTAAPVSDDITLLCERRVLHTLAKSFVARTKNKNGKKHFHQK
jgi:hypothetical protein